ncbi:MAG: putative transporter, major facilitator subfamily protein [Streblomastix strix]|uniref:Putative transporter, major facilitator subfamily protein n=1 Tax=Streblomastix strix TaxID=222440 RepID=A0A5J4WYQ6_9EUKA|nr:MAG: putative transporter, major facilitator subfamily protein [Streblomastix strix]
MSDDYILFQPALRQYKRRFYCLAAFCINSFMRCFELALLNSAPNSTFQYYKLAGIDMEKINLILSIGALSYELFVFLMMYLDTRWNNLRYLTLLSSFALLLSCIIRMFPTWFPNILMPHAFPFLLVGSILNQLGSSFSYSTSSLISAKWFNSQERSIATGISSQSGTIGIGFAFLLIPFIAPQGKYIPIILYIDLGLQFLCTIAILLYFPANPPIPPSYSEQYRRGNFISDAPSPQDSHSPENQQGNYYHQQINNSEQIAQQITSPITQPIPIQPKPILSMKQSLKLLLCPDFINLCLFSGLQAGCTQAWADNITYFYTTVGYQQNIGGIFSCMNIFTSAIGGFVSSVLYEKKFKKHEKLLLFLIFILGIIFQAFFIFALPIVSIHSQTRDPLIKIPLWLFSTMIILIGFLQGAPFGVIFEIGAEQTFPASEAFSGGALTAGINFFYFATLLVFATVPLGYRTIITVGIVAISTVMLMFLRVNRKRQNIEDIGERNSLIKSDKEGYNETIN